LIADIRGVAIKNSNHVVINFECSGHLGPNWSTGDDVRGIRGETGVQQTAADAKQLLKEQINFFRNQGYFLQFSDWSAMTLISAWDPAQLGPLPFHQLSPK
jgi:hypothetical protein